MNHSLPIGCSPNADDVFGPIVDGCRDGFDFTLTFEQYFFTLVPASCLLFTAPFRIRYLSSLPIAVRGTSIRLVKLAAFSLFAVSQLALVGLWAANSELHNLHVAAIASSSLSVVASLTACALSYAEHAKSVKPSVILNTYLFISLILDAATLRSTWLGPLSTPIKAVFTTSFALKLLVLVLEAKEKGEWIIDNGRQRSPEETSGIFNQSLFWWLNSLLIGGYRDLLEPEDLFPLPESMLASVLNEKFWNTWKKTGPHDHKNKLLFMCTKTLKWPILAAVPPRLILVAFTICQPFLLNRFLLYLQNPLESINIGYGLIGAYGIVYIGMAISSGLYSNRSFRMATMLRGLLITAIYQKTTEISIASTDNSAAVTLMSTDVDTIVRAVRSVHDLWADIIQVAIATYVLTTFLGAAAAAPLVVCLLSLGLTLYLSPKARTSQGDWFKRVQRRVGITSKMLGHMKSIKMSGLAQKLASTISQMRIDEINAAKPFRTIMVSTAALAQVPVLISPLAAFAIFAIIALRTGETFDATRMFSSLSLILLLASPLFSTFEVIVNLQSSLACFDRIQKFLARESRQDYRIRPARPLALNAGRGIVDIELKDCSLAWSKDLGFVVKNMDLTVRKGQMLTLVGPVASGKSSLLKGLLGEVPVASGTVLVVQARVSWCDQTPWITNASVRRNILGYSHFNAELYNEVIYACDLQKDLAQFPDRDETIVGSKGISLSGGQKQRVALARAIYSKPEIAVFDDILSGLDNHTVNTICTRLFSRKDGLLKKWGTTVILATQSISSLHMADQIVVLSTSGTVAETGSFKELIAHGGYITSVYKTEAVVANGHQVESEPVSEEVDTSQSKSKSPKSNEIDKRRQAGDNTVYMYYFSSLGWVFTGTFVFIEVVTAFLQIFPNIWLEWWSHASAAEGNQSLGLYLGVYSAFQVAATVSNFTLTWFVILKVVEKSGIALHGRLLTTVIRAPLSLFTRDDTGSITTRFSQDIGEVDRSLPLGLLVSVQYFFTCIGQAVLIASATWYLAISYTVLLPVLFLLQKGYLRTSRQLRFLDLDQKAPVYTQFIETLAGLSTIRAFGWEAQATDMNHELVDRAQRPFYLLLMIQRWLTLVLDFIVAALALLVVGLSVALRDSVSVGLAGVSLVQLVTLAENVRMLILWWTSLETSIGAIARIKQFSENSGDENLPGESREAPKDWPARGQFELRDVCASYDSNTQIKALDGISFSTRAGEKIGIVGRTGSGKSSLLLTLVKMLDLSHGSITLDGMDFSTLSREEVRQHLIAITQDQFFLPGSVRQNIDPYELSSLNDITSALSKVGLSDAIEQKGGLDVEFEEEFLSHGQRQLFFLARAILRKNCGRVVLLDEATSSVDQHTESRVQELLKTEFAEHTVIAIAHRLDTIADFDSVLVLDRGRIVEYGNPADLLQQNSHFKELWSAAHHKEEGSEK
ncbi:multidrug resistance-like protein [Xylariales sp. PMI_506]|nr:multidrug resistance-like protein [Xylariales sp. PMI_506]